MQNQFPDGAFSVSKDGSTAVDANVSWLPMNTCPQKLKVQILTQHGVAIYGNSDLVDAIAWRPIPRITKATYEKNDQVREQNTNATLRGNVQWR